MRASKRLATIRLMKTPLILVGAFLFLISGCGQRLQHVKLTEISVGSEAGYHDVIFSIQDYKKLADGSQVIRAEGLHHGKQVGLEVVLDAAWKKSSLGDDIPLITYQGSARYRSSGAESDLLIQALDQLYETKLSPTGMVKERIFTAISLGGDPAKLDRGMVKIKMFFDPGPEDQQVELFTNIDLNAQTLQISEKDEEYRSAIIRCLRAS